MTRFAVALMFFAAPAFAQTPAQQANPTAACTATAAQLAENKRVAMEFFRAQGADRVALADPSYKQHNPAFKKRDEDNKVSEYEEFKAAFASPQGRGGGRGPATGPTPPQGNPYEVVTAECDIVTVIHRNYRQDPTAGRSRA